MKTTIYQNRWDSVEQPMDWEKGILTENSCIKKRRNIQINKAELHP